MSGFRRRSTRKQRRNVGQLAAPARDAAAAVREAEQDLQDFYASHGVPPGHDFLDEAARVLLTIPGVEIHREADRARLRVQLAAMMPHGAESLVDEAIERALGIASADGEGCQR